MHLRNQTEKGRPAASKEVSSAESSGYAKSTNQLRALALLRRIVGGSLFTCFNVASTRFHHCLLNTRPPAPFDALIAGYRSLPDRFCERRGVPRSYSSDVPRVSAIIRRSCWNGDCTPEGAERRFRNRACQAPGEREVNDSEWFRPPVAGFQHA